MSNPSLTDLYTHYETLSNNSSASDEEKAAAYRVILTGTKGVGADDSRVKRLASQCIVRFAKLFPSQSDDSFNGLLDLCDDDDPVIRKQAVHDLSQFAKRLPTYTTRTADVLVQMMLTDDASEQQIVLLNISQLLHAEPKSTLVGIFNQLHSTAANPDTPREQVLKFLGEKLKTLPPSVLAGDLEQFAVEQLNKTMEDVSQDEFPLIIGILASLNCMSTLTGRQKLVGMITDRIKQTVPDFKKNVQPHDLVVYLLDKVLPSLTDIDDSHRLTLLKPSTDLILHDKTACSQQELVSLFDVLCRLLPQLPSQPDADNEKTNDDPASVDESKLGELECLLFIVSHLVTVGDDNDPFTNNDQLAKSLQAARPRLQYLGRQVSLCSGGTANSSADANTTQQRRRLISNLQAFVRAFFHNPPAFKACASLTPSWRRPDQQIKPTSPSSSITLDNGLGQKRRLSYPPSSFSNHQASGSKRPRGGDGRRSWSSNQRTNQRGGGGGRNWRGRW